MDSLGNEASRSREVLSIQGRLDFDGPDVAAWLPVDGSDHIWANH
jgi:hypothetical protein